MRNRFVPITRKVNLIIIGTLIVGIGALTAFLAGRLTVTIEEDTEATLADEATIVYESIRVLMLNGDATVAEQFLDNLDARMGDSAVYIRRRDGNLAFRDNQTIALVNERLEAEQFEPRTSSGVVRPALDEELFANTVGPVPLPQQFTGQINERWVATLYRPLLNTPLCFTCHGDGHLVRGVVEIRADITSAISERNGAVIGGDRKSVV